MAGPDDSGVTGAPAGPPAGPGDEADRRRRRILVVVGLGLLAVLIGLGVYLLVADDDTTTTTTTLTTSTTTSTTTTSTTSTSTTTTVTTTPVPAAAPCSADALLDGIGGSVQGTPVTVDDFRCSTAEGGYAWALVVPADPELVADPLSVYLRDVGGVWEVLDFGTGITCADTGIPPAACAELP